MKQSLTTAEQLSPILQSARKRSGLTQVELAAALDLSQASLSRLELNTQSMKVSQLLTLCKRLGLELVIRDRAAPSPSSGSASSSAGSW